MSTDPSLPPVPGTNPPPQPAEQPLQPAEDQDADTLPEDEEQSTEV